MISKIICVLIALCLAVPIGNCSMFQVHNGNSYLFSNPNKMNWHSAMRYCRINSMQLVDVPSGVENNVILQLINYVEAEYNNIFNDNSPGYWTSGADLAETGHFYWATNGHAFNFTYWEVGQPKNWKGSENCVHYWSKHNFKWNDENCKSEMYAICNNHTRFGAYVAKTVANGVNL